MDTPARGRSRKRTRTARTPYILADIIEDVEDVKDVKDVEDVEDVKYDDIFNIIQYPASASASASAYPDYACASAHTSSTSASASTNASMTGKYIDAYFTTMARRKKCRTRCKLTCTNVFHNPILLAHDGKIQFMQYTGLSADKINFATISCAARRRIYEYSKELLGLEYQLNARDIDTTDCMYMNCIQYAKSTLQANETLARSQTSAHTIIGIIVCWKSVKYNMMKLYNAYMQFRHNLYNTEYVQDPRLTCSTHHIYQEYDQTVPQCHTCTLIDGDVNYVNLIKEPAKDALRMYIHACTTQNQVMYYNARQTIDQELEMENETHKTIYTVWVNTQKHQEQMHREIRSVMLQHVISNEQATKIPVVLEFCEQDLNDGGLQIAIAESLLHLQ